MLNHSWLKHFTDRLGRTPARSGRRRNAFRPALELLEDRLAPALFAVNSTLDLVNAGPGVTTLRAAIIQANALPGPDTITLPAGTYRLTLAGANEDFAATGDLDIRDSLTILGAGADVTIIDASQIPGDRQVLQRFPGIGAVDIVGVHLTGIPAIPGNITTVAGDGGASYRGDGGPATFASFVNPSAIAVDRAGNLFIAD